MIILLFYAKFVYGLLRIFTFRFKHDRWEIWVIGGIGEVLCFEAYGGASWEGGAMLEKPHYAVLFHAFMM